ncbi:MAG: GntR domain protein [Devosia sp.]|uniref:GntR family transcriptional regulator n=1 Tax=Devosia sp. TaxID=1871048 RepID=UPI002604D75D|nr:GntR family transcriptional regulator [Devosia sp.]MDB5530702.1 GntR domain protein [Devosia sp.]
MGSVLLDEFAHSDTSYRRVADTIRDRIIAGTYTPGMRLKVPTLCIDLAVSSNPVREALQQLQGEGLVVIAPNKGATVRPIDARLIREIYEVNGILDAFFAGRAAQIATDEQIMELIAIHRKLEQAMLKGDVPKRADNNHQFHSLLGEISGNREALTVRLRHRNLMRAMRMKYGFSADRESIVLGEHEEIISAISARDVARAEYAAKMHCLRSCDDIIIQASIEPRPSATQQPAKRLTATSN